MLRGRGAAAAKASTIRATRRDKAEARQVDISLDGCPTGGDHTTVRTTGCKTWKCSCGIICAKRRKQLCNM